MIEIAQAITGITAAIGLTKELGSAEREWSKAELKLKAADLASALADAKLALTEARGKIDTRDKEIEKLKDSFKKKVETVEVHGYHYEARDGRPVGPPFCPHCMNDGRMSRLVPRGFGIGQCPNCKNEFEPVRNHGYEKPNSPNG